MPEHESIHSGGRPVPLLGNFWTIPNMLSIVRLMLMVPITLLILQGASAYWLFGLIVLAVATDWFDGQVARRLRSVSAWGKVLDPLADKVGSALIVMALVVRDTGPTLPLWFLGIIIARDLCIVLGGFVLARRTGQLAVSTFAGKAAVAMLALTVLAALIQVEASVLRVLVWITAGMIAYSFVVYLMRFVRWMRAGPRPEVESVPINRDPDGETEPVATPPLRQSS